jgi:hypothetical protein
MPIEPELFLNLEEERIALKLKYSNVLAEYDEFKALYILVAGKAMDVYRQEAEGAEEAERVAAETSGEAKETIGKTPNQPDGPPMENSAGRRQVVQTWKIVSRPFASNATF